MFGLGKRRNVDVRFETPAHEPSAAERALATETLRVAAIRRVLRDGLARQAVLPPADRNQGLMDFMLDIQSAMATPPPVVPGVDRG